MAYKRENGNLLFVFSQNHPDAHRFFESQAHDGNIGYKNASMLCEFDGDLEVDTSLETRRFTKAALIGRGLPLKIRLRNGHATSLLGNTATDKVDASEVLGEFLRKYTDANGIILYSAPEEN